MPRLDDFEGALVMDGDGRAVAVMSGGRRNQMSADENGALLERVVAP